MPLSLRYFYWIPTEFEKIHDDSPRPFMAEKEPGSLILFDSLEDVLKSDKDWIEEGKTQPHSPEKLRHWILSSYRGKLILGGYLYWNEKVKKWRYTSIPQILKNI